MKKGFTLLELLVVVLIIGILAAIVLPQYRKAVLKTRASTIISVLDMIVKGEDFYYTAHGQGTPDARELDLQVPGTCLLAEDDDGTGSDWSCGEDFKVKLGPDGSYAWALYCPQHNNSTENCKTIWSFQLGWGTSFAKEDQRYAPNSRRCWMPNNADPVGELVCKSLGKPIACGTKTCYEIY